MIGKRSDNQAGEGEWLVTYSDLVTLLLTFFVLLFSFSAVDSTKWKELVKTFTGKDLFIMEDGSVEVIGDHDGMIGIEDSVYMEEPAEETAETEEDNSNDGLIEGEPEEADSLVDEKFTGLYNALVEYSEKEGQGISVTMNEYQVRIRLSNHLLFSTGQARITKENEKLLFELSEIIFKYDDVIDKIVIEGNTDNIPIHNTEYKDNFELSLARSLSVLYYLKNHVNMLPQKLVPMGYGEYNPICDNATQEGRAKNRRTDIVLVRNIRNDDVADIDYGFLRTTNNEGENR